MEDRQKSGQATPLNESWVELYYQNSGQRSPEVVQPLKPLVLPDDSMEKLLREAQREGSASTSKENSNNSSRGSPKSPHSPDQVVNPESSSIKESQMSEWIWDWSSRPEALPREFTGKFVHPKRSRMSVRRSRVLKSRIFSLENLPTLLLTHATSFFLGAAVMFIYIKRYASIWTVVSD